MKTTKVSKAASKVAKASPRSVSKAPKEKPLKIAVLASDPDLYSNRRIMEAGRDRGHEMHFISIRNSRKSCFHMRHIDYQTIAREKLPNRS